MITTRLYLDVRHAKPDNPQSLKLCIMKRGQSAYIRLGVSVLPRQWDRNKQKVIDHPQKRYLNTYLESRKSDIDQLILSLTAEGKLAGLSAIQIKNVVAGYIDPEVDVTKLFAMSFREYADSRVAGRTKELYAETLKKMQSFDSSLNTLTFDMINKDWLHRFSDFLVKQGLSKISRNIHFRNIRAVFNDAIDREITRNYPLRKFDMRPEQTVKRSLSVENLRKLFSHPVEEWQRRYLDYFKLTFFLIGINTVDLLACKPSDLTDGRLRYKRAKTGRLYNIKVEKEAEELIRQYQGNELLVSFGEGITHYHNFTGKCDKGLKSIGSVEQEPNPEWREGSRKHRYHVKYIPSFPDISIYWARHSWATIAASLDIPKETIAAALGHGGNTVTDIYIDFDQKKVDEANRRVIDWVLYKKK